MYDLIIVGGGPAGVAAGVYAARKKLKALSLTFDFGGQSCVSTEIQNWIGFKTISGEELAKQLEEHLRAYAGDSLEIKKGVKVTSVTKIVDGFEVTDSTGEVYKTRTILVATGASRRKLNVPGADQFENKGITYCASCDGPLFTDRDVVVIGGGNAGFESAAQLLAYAKSVTLLHKNAEFKADKVTVEKIMRNPKFKGILNAELKEIKGNQFVEAVTYQDKDSGEIREIKTDGVFVEIGFIPSSPFISNLVKTNEYGAIITDARTQRTSTDGIWAAGDCTDALYHQNNIAAGDGIKALEDIYYYLKA